MLSAETGGISPPIIAIDPVMARDVYGVEYEKGGGNRAGLSRRSFASIRRSAWADLAEVLLQGGLFAFARIPCSLSEHGIDLSAAIIGD